MSFINKFNLKPADRIVMPKSSFGLIMHHAIYYGKDYRGGDIIVENAIGIGVRCVTADAFFKNYSAIKRIERFNGSDLARAQALRRAESQIGKPYDLQNFNCECFCNYVQYGAVQSDQVNNAIAIGGIAVAGILVAALFSDTD